jgi:hypothetical protein
VLFRPPKPGSTRQASSAHPATSISHKSPITSHSHGGQQLLEPDRIGSELASLSGEFTTATDINHVVGKLFKLVAANRIPRRNAELLAYLAQLLLFSQKDVKHEQTIATGYFGRQQIIRDIYVRAGLARPAQTPPPEAQALLAEPSRV